MRHKNSHFSEKYLILHLILVLLGSPSNLINPSTYLFYHYTHMFFSRNNNNNPKARRFFRFRSLFLSGFFFATEAWNDGKIIIFSLARKSYRIVWRGELCDGQGVKVEFFFLGGGA